MDYSTLTDEELAELYGQAPPGPQSEAQRRELDMLLMRIQAKGGE